MADGVLLPWAFFFTENEVFYKTLSDKGQVPKEYTLAALMLEARQLLDSGSSISQSFMMHEYVSYHIAGTAASDIQKKYRQEVAANMAG